MIIDAAQILQIVLAAVFFGFFLLLFFYLWRHPTALQSMLTDDDKGSQGSLSRFQLLLFTFVIAGLYLVLCIENGQFIDIPGNVLGLLGISGGSFVLSKGIGANSAARKAEAAGTQTRVVAVEETKKQP